MVKILLLSLICGVSSGVLIPFKDCGNSEVRSVDVTPCTLNNDVCAIKKGSNVEVKVIYESNNNYNSVNCFINVKASTASFGSYAIITNEPLTNHYTKPIRKGDLITIVKKATIPPNVPKVTAVLEANVHCNNVLTACLKLTTQLTRKRLVKIRLISSTNNTSQ